MRSPHAILKNACYTTNLSMSVIGNLSPLLFLTFRSLYDISYSLLGLLILINFCTQLAIDLLFSFFSHKFSIAKCVKITPILTVIGMLVYTLSPFLFPNHVYLGLVIGTIIFASSGGLAEVLISPVIAAVPSDNPEREMSKLHSVYAWGVVFMVIISTLFLFVFGKENWQWLVFIWILIPIASAILFTRAEIPQMQIAEKSSHTFKLLFNKGFILCFLCMFFGGASECIMAQWSSSYLEQALSIPKVWGDISGVAMFAVMLGAGRSLYAKYGKNIRKVLFFSAIAATICYITAAISNSPLVGLIACGLTGLCTAMLWPGNLIVASAQFPMGGVVLFALMAASGDLGASIGPQLVGLVTDGVMDSSFVVSIASSIELTTEQVSMKIGMLTATLFPFALTIFSTISLIQGRKSQP